MTMFVCSFESGLHHVALILDSASKQRKLVLSLLLLRIGYGVAVGFPTIAYRLHNLPKVDEAFADALSVGTLPSSAP